MNRFRKDILSLGVGGTTCATAFLNGLGGVNFAAVWTQFLSLLLGVLVSILVGNDPSRFFDGLV
ncbi:MAG: hypothetical protein IPM64_09115 [Phycisphaerales bacterium]|nr:hypothetical protein [Phycisphaerales bacterium]